jgi:Uri superfamily endonuclease
LVIGQLGQFDFPAGFYIYLGSAGGPGGIRGRLGRHFESGSVHHWHIDFLKIVSKIRGYGFLIDEKDQDSLPPKECVWSQALAGCPGVSIPVPGFGASDCHLGCPAHLIWFLGSENDIRYLLTSVPHHPSVILMSPEQ